MEKVKTTSEKIKEIFINNVKECIEKGESPFWRTNFWRAKVFNFTHEGRGYRPYNIVLLVSTLGDKVPCVGTFKQWNKLNGNKEAKKDKNASIHIKDGAKGSLLISYVPYYKCIVEDKEERKEIEEFIEKNKYKRNHRSIFASLVEDGKVQVLMGLKGNYVWSMDDTENLSDKFKEKQMKIIKQKEVESKKNENIVGIAKADSIIKSTLEYLGVKLTHKYMTDVEYPYFSPLNKEIVMPRKEQFETEEIYYGTLLHEIGHSTGMVLKRELNADASSKSYAKEELIAEFFSSYLLSLCGIDGKESKENNVSYINSWSKRIMDENKIKTNGGNALLSLLDNLEGKDITSCFVATEKAVNYIMENYEKTQQSTKESTNENNIER